MSLTLITPLRRAPGDARDLRRLRRLLAATADVAGLEALVADDTPSPAMAAQTAACVAAFPHAQRLTVAGGADAPFSIGRMRDAGAAAARTEVVLFHDVDFIAPPDVYRRLAARATAFLVERGRGAFGCVPVFFLTRLGHGTLRAAPDGTWRRLRAALAPSPGTTRPAPALIDRLVLGSSAILAARATLLEVGGHDGAFVGHGGEDFDLMHRLSLAYALGPRPPRYATDFGSRALAAEGFRAYYARYGAPLAAEGFFLAHQWHPPRRADPRYHARREENFTLLRTSLQRSENG